jgi:hypothetical protein
MRPIGTALATGRQRELENTPTPEALLHKYLRQVGSDRAAYRRAVSRDEPRGDAPPAMAQLFEGRPASVARWAATLRHGDRHESQDVRRGECKVKQEQDPLRTLLKQMLWDGYVRSQQCLAGGVADTHKKTPQPSERSVGQKTALSKGTLPSSLVDVSASPLPRPR